jgi:MFS transporter, DHA1 family, staphyloferrin A biosynthesis exporter
MSDSSASAVVGSEPPRNAPPAPRRSRLAAFDVLRYPNYRLLWTGTLFSSSGLWIQQVTVSWLTYEITNSAFLLGAVNGFRAVPLLFLAPLGGVAADRFDQRRLMLVTQLFLMTVTAIFATICVTGHAAVWNIILFTLLTGVAWAFNMPVRQSIIPNTVPRKYLVSAIALNSVGINMTRVLGPSLGGLLIAAVGVSSNFYIQALAYVGVASMVYQLQLPRLPRASRDNSVWRNLVEGLRYLVKHPTLRLQMALALIPVVIALPYISLLPIFARDVLGVGAEGYGLMMAAPGIGALVGTGTIATIGSIKRKGLLLFIALAGLGLSLVIFSFSRAYPLSLLLLALAGGFQMT